MCYLLCYIVIFDMFCVFLLIYMLVIRFRDYGSFNKVLGLGPVLVIRFRDYGSFNKVLGLGIGPGQMVCIGPSQMVTRVTILMALMPLDIGLKPNPLIKYLIKYGLSTHSGDWPTSQAGLVA